MGAAGLRPLLPPRIVQDAVHCTADRAGPPASLSAGRILPSQAGFLKPSLAGQPPPAREVHNPATLPPLARLVHNPATPSPLGWFLYTSLRRLFPGPLSPMRNDRNVSRDGKPIEVVAHGGEGARVGKADLCGTVSPLGGSILGEGRASATITLPPHAPSCDIIPRRGVFGFAGVECLFARARKSRPCDMAR